MGISNSTISHHVSILSQKNELFKWRACSKKRVYLRC
uniref:Uncharacterized protein n=1 Tax=Anaerobacillus isosaccharinicus TaxID=1532552 RepID=A0A7S7L5Z3_9BACI|nr:hypothetical protein [Anaerobacillus isosaccharinicus]QOY35069.1 hypothetical protein AWH56_020530 [Anaerobacillus isosaccharinicus]